MIPNDARMGRKTDETVYCERILTICRWGLVRSVALREVLIRELGVDSIAVGLEKNSDSTIRQLSEWADVIVVASTHLMRCRRAGLLPPGKTVVLNLGRDVWQNARHKKLFERARQELAPHMARIRQTRAANKAADPPRTSRLPA